MSDLPGDNDDTLIGISFGDLFRAREFHTAVGRLSAMGRLKLKDAVFVVAGADGNTVVTETTDPTPGKAAVSGALWASLFGLMVGGPVGWIAGAAIGAGAGAATAKAVDLGIPDEWVDWFRQAAQPGRTTLAILATDVDRTAMADELGRFTGATLVYANLPNWTIDRWRSALGESVSEGESVTEEQAPSDGWPAPAPPSEA
jgi:uncharacterized membrane protein